MFILGYYYFGSSKSESVISLHFACSCCTIYKVVVRLIWSCSSCILQGTLYHLIYCVYDTSKQFQTSVCYNTHNPGMRKDYISIFPAMRGKNW